MFKRIVCIIAMVLLLNASFCLANASEIDKQTETLVTYAYDQTLHFAEVLHTCHMEGMWGSISDLAGMFEDIPYKTPQSITVQLAESSTEATDRTNDLDTNLCFSMLTLANFQWNTLEAAWAEMASTYGVADIPDFHGMGYVGLNYGEELPSIVTAFFKSGEGHVLTKTGIVLPTDNVPGTYASLYAACVNTFGDVLRIDVYENDEFSFVNQGTVP